jgi:hypothetical protein
MIIKPPRYSVGPSEFPFRALAALAGRLAIGGPREIAMAALVTARLVAGALSPNRLPLKSREARAENARHWLMGLALPANARNLFLRLVEATGTDDIDDMGRTLAQMLELVDPHLDNQSRLELGRLVHRVSADQSVEALERQPIPTQGR